MYVHTYTHPCIHAFIHLYIRTYTHAYMHTKVHTHIQKYIHTREHTYRSTYIHTHTYIHTGVHTHIHDKHNIHNLTYTKNAKTTHKHAHLVQTWEVVIASSTCRRPFSKSMSLRSWTWAASCIVQNVYAYVYLHIGRTRYANLKISWTFMQADTCMHTDMHVYCSSYFWGVNWSCVYDKICMFLYFAYKCNNPTMPACFWNYDVCDRLSAMLRRISHTYLICVIHIHNRMAHSFKCN